MHYATFRPSPGRTVSCCTSPYVELPYEPNYWWRVPIRFSVREKKLLCLLIAGLRINPWLLAVAALLRTGLLACWLPPPPRPQGPRAACLVGMPSPAERRYWHDKGDSAIYRRRHEKWLGDVTQREAIYPRRKPFTSLLVHSPPIDEHVARNADDPTGMPGGLSHPTFGEVARLPPSAWRPAKVGDCFGPLWATHWFRCEVHVPAEWAGEEVHLRWNSGTEALLLSESGEALQGLTAGFRSGPREEYVLYRSAPGSEGVLVLFVEMACNDLLPSHDLLLGGPQIPGGMPAAQSYELRTAEISVYDRQLADLFANAQLLFELADELPQASQIAVDARAELNAVVNAFRIDDRRALERALALSRRALARSGEAERHVVSAVGHCHIDTAWLVRIKMHAQHVSWPLSAVVTHS
jgi:hypothetical protein